MTKSWRINVVSLVAIGAFLLGKTWMERGGIFALAIALVITIDLTGDNE